MLKISGDVNKICIHIYIPYVYVLNVDDFIQILFLHGIVLDFKLLIFFSQT
jgi:hypothetical protein